MLNSLIWYILLKNIFISKYYKKLMDENVESNEILEKTNISFMKDNFEEMN